MKRTLREFGDPPDDVERWRNNLIEDQQRTRNPFIDDPEIVRLLDMHRADP